MTDKEYLEVYNTAYCQGIDHCIITAKAMNEKIESPAISVFVKLLEKGMEELKQTANKIPLSLAK